MSTLNYDSVNFDYCQDYRYFFMPSTQYYYELSEMSMVLANMVNKKCGINRRWNKDTNYVNRIANDSGGITTNSYRETYNTNGIACYMNYIGLDDIEEYDMSNTIGDPNVCRYVIGHRDVVYSLGRTQNVVRNVITVAIGEIPEKTSELTANLYGLLGDNEEHSEYHHIGYDITASRILENVLRFADRYSGNQKVFFITGARSAGGVANLLSKKLIDKFGQNSIYGYTFNAVATINGNMIPEGSKIPNLRYAPIMNIYNDDEMMVMFTSEETNMYKYGTNVHMSLSENLTPKVASAFRKVHGSNYDKNMKSKVVNLLNRTFNINLSGYSAMVFGMTETEEVWEYEDVGYEYTYEEIDKNLNEKIHDGLSDERRQELLLFWAGLYNVSQKDPNYAVLGTEARDNVRKIEELKNESKKIGQNNIESVEDYSAETNAINNSDNQRIETAINYENNNQAYLDSGKTLIDAIKELARFYINNIPTYKKSLKSDLCTIPATNANLPKESMGDAYIYKSYMFDSLTELKTDKFLINHKARTGFDGAYDMNKFPRYTGDFCGDFAMSVVRIDANGKRGEEMSLWDVTEYPPSEKRRREVPVYGFNLHNTLAISMYGAKEDANGNSVNDTPGAEGSWNFENAMIKLGYEKIKVTTEMTIDDLEVGDLLISKDHAEFYVGVAYNSEYYRNNADLTEDLKKKSGTKVIHQIYGPVRRLNEDNKAEGTFGWGNVHDEFPVEDKDGKHYTYFFKKDNEAYFRLCQCGKDPTETDSQHRDSNCNFGNTQCQYEIIWRKK